MPKMTIGYANNVIRRALYELVDPPPTKEQLDELWEFFNSKCAYCGKRLTRSRREGHVDHLVSSASGGRNHVSNRVLSCARCNEEKLDLPWQRFLHIKSATKRQFESRKRKIDEWKRVKRRPRIDKKSLNLVKKRGDEIAERLERVAEEIRQSGSD